MLVQAEIFQQVETNYVTAKHEIFYTV